MALLQVPRHGGTVSPPQHSMDMHAGFSVRTDGDIAHQRGNLDLLVDGNRLVFLELPVEERQLGAGERPNCRDL